MMLSVDERIHRLLKEQEYRVISSALSDPHNGGQCAVLFACGEKKYVYKPRPGKMDWAWADFLESMEKIMDVPLPRAVKPLSARDAENTVVPFVEGREAETEADIHRYYQRCGGLLALCMVLGSTDLHEENLIAEGDSPVLVDVETLLSGLTKEKAGREITFYDQLIFSHLLPNWALDEGMNKDVGALSALGKNMPRLRGTHCPPWRYLSDITEAFRRACEGIISHRREMLKALDAFRGASCRKLLRPTDLYDRMCRQIRALPSPEEKRASANRLARAYARAGEAWQRQMEKACQSEMDAVIRGDIPYFYSLAEEKSLRAMEGVVAEEYYALSPLDATAQRVQALTAERVQEQVRVIFQSLRSACPEIRAVKAESAMDVFHLLEANAVDENPCSFLGVTVDERGSACFQSIGFHLYEGLMGVLVFYAALYEATGDARVLAALEKRYEGYRRHFILPDAPVWASAHTLCLTNGLAGHIMGIAYISRCLKEKRYIQDAARLYRRFRFPEGLEADADIYNGTAGLLPALPLLMGQGMDDSLSQVARRLAKGLRVEAASLTGFAHGAAGMALALGAAGKVSGDDYSADILHLLQWENARYSEENGNWPDLRDPGKTGFMKGLCSGAPGIGLARKQLMQYTDHEGILRICREDIEKTIRFLEQENAVRRDTLCCGNAALTEAARTLGCKASFLHEEPILYHPLNTDDFPAGLFQGWAGVGYARARLMEKSVNSLFVWGTR